MRRIQQAWQDRSLATRFLIIYLLISLITVASLTWRSGTQLSTALEEEFEHELELQAFVIASALSADVESMMEGEGSPTHVLALLQQFSRDTESRITFLDTNLRVLFSSDPNVIPHREDSHPEVVAALRGEEQHDIRPDEFTGEMRLFVAAPVREEEHIIGIVQISTPWARVHTRVFQEWTRLILTGGVAVLINILVSLWLAYGIVRPLRQLTEAARDIAAGHLDRRIPVNSRDEVGTLARAFNEMAERLEEMITRQRMFIANASHELRSPVTSIKLRTEALLDDANMPPERRQRFIKEVDQEADRLRRLAERLLDLSRLQMQPDTSPFQVVNLAALLREVADVMAPRAARAGLHFNVDIPERLPPVQGVPDDLEDLFINVVDNALKYTPAGGDVSLRAWVEDEQVVVAVSDTGEGIPPEDLPHIFAPFYRVDKARSRRVDGSGLGLAIVKTIVDVHGGSIDVSSKPGSGTTFYIRLPLYSAPASGPSQPQQEAKTSG